MNKINLVHNGFPSSRRLPSCYCSCHPNTICPRADSRENGGDSNWILDGPSSLVSTFEPCDTVSF